LLGIDGRKMSKSYENSIYMSDTGDVLKQKVAAMYTDPQRQRRKDPGRPELCNVFTFHELYTPLEKTGEIAAQCRNAGIGCTDCKKILGAGIQIGMNLIHERQAYYRNHLQEVRDIIADGDIRARAVARKTMDEVRAAMKISYGL